MNYYQVLMSYLSNAAYSLDSATERIDYGVMRGKLTSTEAQELLAYAGKYATQPPLEEQVSRLEAQLAEYAGLVIWRTVAVTDHFPEGTLVLSEGNVFRCIAAHEKGGSPAPALDGTHWQLIA